MWKGSQLVQQNHLSEMDISHIKQFFNLTENLLKVSGGCKLCVSFDNGTVFKIEKFSDKHTLADKDDNENSEDNQYNSYTDLYKDVETKDDSMKAEESKTTNSSSRVVITQSKYTQCNIEGNKEENYESKLAGTLVDTNSNTSHRTEENMKEKNNETSQRC